MNIEDFRKLTKRRARFTSSIIDEEELKEAKRFIKMALKIRKDEGWYPLWYDRYTWSDIEVDVRIEEENRLGNRILNAFDDFKCNVEEWVDGLHDKFGGLKEGLKLAKKKRGINRHMKHVAMDRNSEI